MRVFAPSHLLLALLLAVACKPDYPSCRNDQDCREKEFCVNQQCQQCRADTDCGTGFECKGGRCESAACSEDSQCPANQSCIAGKCTPCQSDGECGPGGRCYSGRCQRGRACRSDSDCAQDEECKGGVCVSGRPSAGTGQCNPEPVYFDFNESSITTEGAATLQRNVDCLKKSGKSAQLVGHTDPRGTDEYNLALSERRAQSVRSYLERLGVDGGKMKTVPRGEVDASGTDEAGWSKDRRVDFQW